MSMDRATLKTQLVQHEDYRRFAYDDATGRTLKRGDVLVGNLTIGIGRNLSDVGLGDDEIDLLFQNDADRVVHDLITFQWFPALDPVRQRALFDVRLNLGPKGFRTFKKMLAAMARKDYTAAGKELLNSKWRTQVGEGRALRLERMITDGRDE